MPIREKLNDDLASDGLRQGATILIAYGRFAWRGSFMAGRARHHNVVQPQRTLAAISLGEPLCMTAPVTSRLATIGAHPSGQRHAVLACVKPADVGAGEGESETAVETRVQDGRLHALL